MTFLNEEDWEDFSFNGYLYSLRHCCNVLGHDDFCKDFKHDKSRVMKLYNSNLHGSNFIEDLLHSNEFSSQLKALLREQDGIDSSIIQARAKSRILIEQLKQKRLDFCGIGTRKTKLLLNKQIKEGSDEAKLIRLALEIEDTNIQAKDAFYYYQERIYNKKEQLIKELCQLCSELNINYGWGDSDIPTVSAVFYFDLPCGQVSWHSDLNTKDFPRYEQEWDGLECSTLNKLEKYICENWIMNIMGLPVIIDEKIPAGYIGLGTEIEMEIIRF